jgi:cytochrome b
MIAKAVRVTESGSETRSGAVKVWDPITRTFHWLASAWYSGGIWDNPHLVTGYGVAVLIPARIVWGFVGSRYARFQGHPVIDTSPAHLVGQGFRKGQKGSNSAGSDIRWHHD